LDELVSNRPTLRTGIVKQETTLEKFLRARGQPYLPLMQPIKVRASHQSQNAKALGITIPHNLLLLADEVIK
jgi:hypothetical protein